MKGRLALLTESWKLANTKKRSVELLQDVLFSSFLDDTLRPNPTFPAFPTMIERRSAIRSPSAKGTILTSCLP